MNKILISSMLAATLAFGAGYKIPEQSTDSIGLAASNVAKSFGADAAYFNPANMPFLEDRIYLESMVSYFKTSQATFNGDGSSTYRSEPYSTAGGTFHAVSNDLGGFRLGFSAYVPAGLEMRWNDAPQDISRHFNLNIIGLNPSIAYAINDQLSVAFGLNAYYIRGETSGEFYRFSRQGLPVVPSRHMKGHGWAFGYNLALAYKPLENLSFGLTYRSRVNFNIKGHAEIKGFPDLSAAGQPNFANLLNYSGKAKVTGLIVPASLVVGTAWDVTPDTTLLFAVERTFWSKLKGYDFEFGDASARHNNPAFLNSFDAPTKRSFKDSNVYRVGVHHKFNQKWRGMLGFAYDEGAAADLETVSFEIPDTKAYVYSVGLAYAPSQNLEFGLGYIYQDRKSARAKVEVAGGASTHETGGFKRASIQIMGASVKYKF
ncbi:OmpP1/FadL family transporter [Campylobacter sp. 19-13652]|uniref:OmpP1/FadL family transporter n=1 Tax=Campylobacter sp. 19-13652 TaxID=2840180 RepID=UPI001C78CD8A|nr:outer membrane protein transport protein [Campylobacter sp. 19-13652]BCX78853.1 hypothetical protein LBC_03150 [Campylobacter sp. 19-13652]